MPLPMPASHSSPMTPFGERLGIALHERGRLCVGVDPSAALLSLWGLPETADGLRTFCHIVLEALHDEVAVVKPQSAFFERFGSRGIAVLEDVCASAKDAGFMVILDAKRGDIGSTSAAYAEAYLCGSHAMQIDALTVSPYLGFESLRPLIDAAGSSGKGVFVLASTSNAEAFSIQAAVLPSGMTVEQDIFEQAMGENRRWLTGSDEGASGPVGLVVGATIAAQRLPLRQTNGYLLAPGLGAQGATPADIGRLFAACRRRVLPSASRDVLTVGPDQSKLKLRARRLRDEIEQAFESPV